ncbi:MAG: hypothetical protein DSY32_03035 [Aquifex sp.]|nr:MAG: hypothetical protein DSY32_03035 [Aquifex sp.]
MKVKIRDLNPIVKNALERYAITLINYYKSKGIQVGRKEVIKKIGEKLKAIELMAIAGSPKKEVVALKLSTFEEKLNPKYGIKVLEERPHMVWLSRKTGKAKCTCKWFEKHKVCKHVVKALLLKEHGPTYLRRKLNLPSYKEDRKKVAEKVAA